MWAADAGEPHPRGALRVTVLGGAARAVAQSEPGRFPSSYVRRPRHVRVRGNPRHDGCTVWLWNREENAWEGSAARVKCPCLYSDVAPICRAETMALRIPSPEQLARFCTTGRHQRCDLYRRFLGITIVKPVRPGRRGER
jgi:hypothetical protein